MLSWPQKTMQGQRFLINNNTHHQIYFYKKKGGNSKTRNIAAKPVNSHCSQTTHLEMDFLGQRLPFYWLHYQTKLITQCVLTFLYISPCLWLWLCNVGWCSSMGTPPKYNAESTLSLTTSPTPLTSSAQSSTAAKISKPRLATDSFFQSPSQ